MQALVTGAAGFIGSHVSEQLLARGHRVLCIDDLSGGLKENFPEGNEAHNWILDCADSDAVGAVIARHGQIDVLVHCAANAREGASQFQPRSVCYRNLYAFSNVLSHAIVAGVKNIVSWSSMAVYGAQVPPFDETMPLAPEDVYGVNKAAMEQTLHILAEVHGLNYVVIRPHNVIGPRQALYDPYRNVAGIWMNRIMRGEPMTVYGDGKQTRAFSYIDDSLPCFLDAIERCEELGKGGQVINVGGMEHIELNTLADAVREAMGVPDHPLVYIKERPCEVKNAFTTYAKSVRLLNYVERVGWREGIDRMAVWAKEQGPQAWRNNEHLEIINDQTPQTWRDIHDAENMQ